MDFVKKNWILILIVIILIIIVYNYWKKNKTTTTNTNGNNNQGGGVFNFVNPKPPVTVVVPPVNPVNPNLPVDPLNTNLPANTFKVGSNIYVKQTPACLYVSPNVNSESKTCYFIKDTLIGTYSGISADGKFVFIQSDEWFQGGGAFGFYGSVGVYVKSELVYSK